MIDFSALAKPTGFSGACKEVTDIYRRRLVADFIACCRLLAEESPELVELTGFLEYFHQLSKLSGETISWLFRLPIMAFWCDVLRKLIARRTYRYLAPGHPTVHLREFGRFVLAAYLYQGLQAEIKVRLDRDGRLYLPGLKGVLICPKRLRLAELTAQLDQKCLILKSVDGEAVTVERPHILEGRQRLTKTGWCLANGFQYRYLPVAHNLFEISNEDQYLRLPERVSYTFEPLTKPTKNRWVTSIEQAWDIVRSTDPLVADEIAHIIDVMVPVVSERPDVHTSSSFPELPGGFYISWHPDVLVLAEAIVHEYHHIKLNMILEIDPIITGGTEEAVFYSPWRDDPRPLSGLLHAVYAFSGVTRFWLDYMGQLGDQLNPLRTHGIPHRVVKSLLQLEYAIASLRQHTSFTQEGMRLVESLSQEFLRMKDHRPTLSASDEAFICQSLQNHFERWQQRQRATQTPGWVERKPHIVEAPAIGAASSQWTVGSIGLELSNEPKAPILTNQAPLRKGHSRF